MPNALILTEYNLFYYLKYNHLPDETCLNLKKFLEQSGDSTLFAIRCGDKNSHKVLPSSLINVGLKKKFQTENSENYAENYHLYKIQLENLMLVSKKQCVIENLIELPTFNQVLEILMMFYSAFNNLENIQDKGIDFSIIIQTMVYGNRNHRSGYGTAYTRNPYNGDKVDYCQFMVNKQGIEVNNIADEYWKDISELKLLMPTVYCELKDKLETIENHYKDIRFVEFVIEDSNLFFTQLSKRNRVYFPGIFEPRGLL